MSRAYLAACQECERRMLGDKRGGVFRCGRCKGLDDRMRAKYGLGGHLQESRSKRALQSILAGVDTRQYLRAETRERLEK